MTIPDPAETIGTKTGSGAAETGIASGTEDETEATGTAIVAGITTTEIVDGRETTTTGEEKEIMGELNLVRVFRRSNNAGTEDAVQIYHQRFHGKGRLLRR